MDSQLQRLAKSHRCIYTRYADDITISTYLPIFPKVIATQTEDGIELGNDLFQIIINNGFEINHAKVRLQRKNKRQEVTGLTVNKFPNIQRDFVRQIRAMLYAWQKHGLEAAQMEYVAKYAKKHRAPWRPAISFRHVVSGKIEFLGMVRGKTNPMYLRFNEQLRKLDPDLVQSVELLEEVALLPEAQLLNALDAELLTEKELQIIHKHNDEYVNYEQGIEKLIEQLRQDSPHYVDALSFEMQLRENIMYCRKYGETDTSRANRHRIIDQLNHLTLETLQVSFNSLCN